MNPDETVMYVLILSVMYWIWASIFGGDHD